MKLHSDIENCENIFAFNLYKLFIILNKKIVSWSFCISFKYKFGDFMFYNLSWFIFD